MKKRLLSMLLVFSFILPLIPYTAAAADTGTLYMNFIEKTSGFVSGNTYLFLRTHYTSSDAVSSISGETAQLTITSTSNASAAKMNENIPGLSPSQYVTVGDHGSGFDGCTEGGIVYTTINPLFSGQWSTASTGTGWYYWCSGGGCRGSGPYYAYTYNTVSFAAGDVVVTPKRTFGATDTVAQSDLTVEVKGYNVSDFTITDGSVTGSDRSYSIDVGGVSVTKTAGYIITYTTDAGSTGSNTTAVKIPGTPIYVPTSDGTYAGHYFKGWSLASVSPQTVNYLPGSEFNVDANTILYAVWAPNVYFTVTINGASQQVQSGTTATPPGSNPSKATEYYNASGAVIAGANDTTADAVKKVAYTFAGWQNTATGQIWDFSTPVTGELNLTPSYSETISYKVSFSASGYSAESQWIMTGSVAAAPGTSPSKATEYYNASGALLAGEDDATPDAAKKIIYTFGGWKNSATGQTWNFNTPVTGAVTLVPDFNQTVYYKVSFDKNNASSDYTSGDQWIQAGQHVSEVNAPATVSTGSPAVTYYFAGWNTKADGSGEYWNFYGDVVNSRVTLYAQWNTVDSYNITFDDNLTDPIDDYIWYTGSLTANGVAATGFVTAPTMSRVDYHFDGWYTNSSCNASNAYNLNRPLSENNAAGLDTDKDKCITLYAKWTPEYTSENDVLVSDSALQGGTYARFYSSSLNAFVNNSNYNTPAAKQVYRNFFLVSKTGTTVSPSTLPAGLYLNKRTGEVYGVPTEVGDFTFYVRIANDEGKWISLTYPITVSIAKAPVTVDMKDDNTGLGKVYGENDPSFYSSQLTVAEGTSEITYYNDSSNVQLYYNYSTDTVISSRATNEAGFNPSNTETLKYAPDLLDTQHSFIPANKTVLFRMEYGRTGGEDAGAYKLSMAPAGITCNVLSNYDITIAERLQSTALTYSGSELTTAPEYVFTVSTKPGMSYNSSAAAEYGTYASGDDVKATLTNGAGLVGNNDIKVIDGFQSVVLASGNVSTAGKLKAGTYNSGFTPIIVNTAVPRGTNSAENATTTANYATPAFSLTIAPKALTVAGKDTSLAVGLTFSVSDLNRLIDLGYIPGDKVGITLTSLEISGKTYNLTDDTQKAAANAALAVLTKTPGTYALTIGYSSALTGADAANYSVAGGVVEGVKLSVYTVYMPSAPVALYTVTGNGTATGSDQHGTVKSDVTEAAAGSNVNLTPVPENGYRLSGVRIVDAEHNVIGYTDNGNGSITFKMPASGVTFEYYFTLNAADPNATGISKVLNTAEHNAYLRGYPDGTLNPDGNMTRAEAAQMFYSLLSETPTGSALSFPDVKQGDWFYQAVTAMTQLGIVDGNDGIYNPNKNITRAEFISMAVRFANYKESTSNFSDVNKTYWAYNSISAATAYGWISGYDDGTFRPNDQITRAEVSVIMNRVLGRVPDRFFIDDNQLKLKTFPDLSAKDWCYYDLVDATNGHNFDMSKSSLETWENTK